MGVAYTCILLYITIFSIYILIYLGINTLLLFIINKKKMSILFIFFKQAVFQSG